MKSSRAHPVLNVAIACGGTGGHLFPGMAVAEQLLQRQASVTLLISEKEIDQLAVKTAPDLKVATLPAVGLNKRQLLDFLRGFLASYRKAKAVFAQDPPQAVLAMGGFTSAAPMLVAKRHRAATFLHESNTIPGRANRWLGRVVDQAFVGFRQAAEQLPCRSWYLTGTPVRTKFRGLDVSACRIALGLDPNRPVVVVMGGSQGAHGINQLVMDSLGLQASRARSWQWLHLAGSADCKLVAEAYSAAGLDAKVYPFLAEMELAMGAATAAVSRAGASSLAELAATRLPALLVPFPAATDNHQFHNARVFEQTGAAKLLEQSKARPEQFVAGLLELVEDHSARQTMQSALSAWDYPHAAEQIADGILEFLAKAKPAAPVPKPADASHGTRSGSSDARTQALAVGSQRRVASAEPAATL